MGNNTAKEYIMRNKLKPFDKGYKDFKRWSVMKGGNKTNKVNPFHFSKNPDENAIREWERGYNKAYFENLNAIRERS